MKGAFSLPPQQNLWVNAGCRVISRRLGRAIFRDRLLMPYSLHAVSRTAVADVRRLAAFKAAQSLGRKTAGMVSGTGTRITAGPLDNKNLPFILLDRAMVVVWYLASRAHAKRDNVHVDPAVLKESLDSIKASTQHWPEELRSACGSYVRASRSNSSLDRLMAAT